MMQQIHLPKDEPATEEQEWGYSLEAFFEGNWEYLLGILIVLLIFLYARYNWQQRNKNERNHKD